MSHLHHQAYLLSLSFFLTIPKLTLSACDKCPGLVYDSHCTRPSGSVHTSGRIHSSHWLQRMIKTIHAASCTYERAPTYSPRTSLLSVKDSRGKGFPLVARHWMKRWGRRIDTNMLTQRKDATKIWGESTDQPRTKGLTQILPFPIPPKKLRVGSLNSKE